ncbi:hypothetical protein G6514_001496 [Epicoccum nigrum]|nr:hypothetical protein G6514_001496 [Epicoccum nigrum]
MNPYAYEPLDKGEIRLLKLYPKPRFGPISGTLLHVPLVKPTYRQGPAGSAYLEHLYPYDAISYSWGTNTSTPFSLVIDQKYIVRVTAHLHYILEKIVQPDRHVLFWIDAICINQADRDSEEKSQQIGLMPDVYRFAKRVQIHLGPETDDSPFAIEFIEHVAEYAEFLDESLNRRNSEAYALALEMGFHPPANNHRTWDALRAFWARPWFRRIWVAQEFINGLDPIIHCGDLEIDWKTLWLAAGVFQSNDSLIKTGLSIFTYHLHTFAREGATSYLFMGDMRLRYWGYLSELTITTVVDLDESRQSAAWLLGQRGLRDYTLDPVRHDLFALQTYERLSRSEALQKRYDGSKSFLSGYAELVIMLNRTCGFLATNPVDRIYALLGLVCDVDPDKPDFRIEYAADQGPATVCRRFAAGLIKRGQGAIVLGMAGTTRQAAHINELGSPSWVPEWTTVLVPGDYTVSLNFSIHASVRQTLSYHAAGTSSMNARLQDEDKTLIFRGACLDSLFFIMPGRLFCPPDFYLRPFLRLLGPGADIASVKDVLWRTLIANKTAKGEDAPPEFVLQYQAYRDRMADRFALVCIIAGILFLVVFLPLMVITLRWLDDVSFFLIQTTATEWDKSPLLSLAASALIRTDSWLLFFVGCCLLIWRTKGLLADYLQNTTSGWSVLSAFALANYGSSASPRGPPESEGFVESLKHTAGRYHLGYSKAGLLGLFPLATELGDTIVVLEGASTPFVLRSIGDEEYRLVGECYVHGVMKGEIWDAASRELRDFRVV